eukprot:g61601.t1
MHDQLAKSPGVLSYPSPFQILWWVVAKESHIQRNPSRSDRRYAPARSPGAFTIKIVTGGSPCRWIDMGELIDSGVGGKVDPWTNEDVPDFPLEASGPGQAFPRGSVDLSFQQVFMVDQDGPSSSARNTQLVVMLEPAKDVGKRLQGKRMMASSDVNAKGGPSLKRAKICSVAKLRDLHSTMQGGDAPVNASNGVAQAQVKRDQLTSGLPHMRILLRVGPLYLAIKQSRGEIYQASRVKLKCLQASHKDSQTMATIVMLMVWFKP